jgi:hypothetical protein
MMALPFLPENEIEPMFQGLQRQASESLQPFKEYVSSVLTCIRTPSYFSAEIIISNCSNF